jgi:hypothetical protein
VPTLESLSLTLLVMWLSQVVFVAPSKLAFVLTIVSFSKSGYNGLSNDVLVFESKLSLVQVACPKSTIQPLLKLMIDSKVGEAVSTKRRVLH